MTSKKQEYSTRLNQPSLVDSENNFCRPGGFLTEDFLGVDNNFLKRYNRQLILKNWSLEKQQQIQATTILTTKFLPSMLLYLTGAGFGEIILKIEKSLENITKHNQEEPVLRESSELNLFIEQAKKLNSSTKISFFDESSKAETYPYLITSKLQAVKIEFLSSCKKILLIDHELFQIKKTTYQINKLATGEQPTQIYTLPERLFKDDLILGSYLAMLLINDILE